MENKQEQQQQDEDRQLTPEEIADIERQMGVKHLDVSQGHGMFRASFVVDQVVILPSDI